MVWIHALSLAAATLLAVAVRHERLRVRPDPNNVQAGFLAGGGGAPGWDPNVKGMTARQHPDRGASDLDGPAQWPIATKARIHAKRQQTSVRWWIQGNLAARPGVGDTWSHPA